MLLQKKLHEVTSFLWSFRFRDRSSALYQYGYEDFTIVKKKKTKSYKESRSRYRSKVKNINVANDKFIKSMKTLIPGLTDNVDRAGALEYAVRYIQFLQSKLDSDYEEDFLAAIRNDKP